MQGQPQETLVDTHPTFVVAESPKQDLWDTVLSQLDDVAQRLNLDPGIHAILRQPERELTVSVPVVMDDGLIKVFTGYRVQHSSARGPCKGYSLSPRRESQRSQSTGSSDDLEMRGGRDSLRRSQGWRRM